MMRIKTKAVRAALLLAGVGAVLQPGMALAQKDKKGAEAAPKIQLSDGFRKVAQPAQTALQAKKWAEAEPLVAAAEAAAKTDDDKFYAQQFRLQLIDGQLVERANGDANVYAQGEAALVGPLDALIANPKLPQDARARFLYKRGQIEYGAKRYKEAIGFFDRAREAGFSDRNLTLNIAQARAESGDLTGAATAIRTAIDAEKAAGRKAPLEWYRYARSKVAQAKLNAQVNEWSLLIVKDYPTAKHWREAVLLYGFNGAASPQLDKRAKIDLWRLLRVNKALADQGDYIEYAGDLGDVGLGAEAKAVIDEGRAAGKIPASSGPANMVYSDAQKQIASDGPIEGLAKRAQAAPNGGPAAATGDLALGTGNYARAIELYKLALSKGGVKVDEVNTHLAMAQALSGDKASAKATFALVKTPPRSDIAGYWVAWLDQAGPTTQGDPADAAGQ
ncbi:MAG: hypothetical protein A4S12_10435 [Proteobacteria bacterium SG_bin5]|nr:hypothetical protein [Sphingomonas sp.]OQW40406.1 MAG: hypothetical protein A4S12_10435 [Proteobacteria bacterium SG_bin5]